MDKFSKTFREAFSNMNYNFSYAIDLYSKEINDNDYKNFIAWNNRGVTKVYLSIAEKNPVLIKSAIEDFKKAIELANEYDNNGYKDAEENIEWAEEINKSMLE